MEFSQTERVLILVGVVLFVIVINFALFSSLRKGKSPESLQMMIKTTKAMRSPFESEEKELAELSRAVRELQQSDQTQHSDTDS